MVDALLALGKLLFSALLGGLVGIEREFDRRLQKRIPIGVRTMIFISVFGTLSVVLSELVQTELIMVVGLSGIILFSALSYYARYKDYKAKGLTTYTAALIMYLVGVLVGYNEFLIGVIITVIIALVLSLKTEIHGLVKVMSRKELKATILFVIIALVVLPLLPNEVIDSLGVFNPFKFWSIVVIISALSFASYILLRIVKDGLSLTGLLGGFLNAKVTVFQLVNSAKRYPKARQDIFNGVLLSIAASLIAIILIALIGTSNMNVLSESIPVLIITGAILILFIKKESKSGVEKLNVTNPFTLTSALKMAFLIFIFLQGAYLITRFIHPSLIYPVIALSALISSFATTASVASLYTSGVITEGVTISLLVLTAAINVFNKILFVRLGGDKKLFNKTLKVLLLWSFLIFAYFVFIQLVSV